MGSRVLVTGGSGFVGRWLVRRLVERGHAVVATTTADAPPGGPPSVEWRRLVLPDGQACRQALAGDPLDAVVHLAAVTTIEDAERGPSRALDVNVRGTDALLRALGEVDPDGTTRFVFISTAQVYDTRSGGPAAEGDALLPANFYARTKLAAEAFCEAHAQSTARPLIVLRPFNHSGPGQGARFVVSDFAHQVARMELGLVEPILRTGDLSVRRDFTHVRDVCEAYELAAAGGISPGTYNVCSERASPLTAVIAALQDATVVPFEVHTEESRLRRGEIDELWGSAAAIREECGWRAQASLEEIVTDALKWWRENELG